MNKEQFLNLIESHIDQFEYHITIVTGNSPLPKYFYTIGMSERIDFELAFAGGAIYKIDEIKSIINIFFEKLKDGSVHPDQTIQVENLGNFRIFPTDESWCSLMFDGIFDYYKKKVAVYQVVPVDDHKTLEIPNMSKKFMVDEQPIWQWLVNDWNYPVDKNAIAFTDLEALYGKPILEVMRWEDLEWEMFSSDGTKIPTDKKRAVSLGTMIGIDLSLKKVLDLQLEKGIWRESKDSDWNDWG